MPRRCATAYTTSATTPVLTCRHIDIVIICKWCTHTWGEPSRATTPESNTCCPERPAPGKERSSIAIRPTRRPLLFPIRRSLFRTRARRYFPRVPLPTAFATRLSLFLSRVRGALSLSLYSRDRNEVAGLIVIILIGFVNSILRIDRRGVNKEFVVSIRRRNVIRGLIIWYHFISSAKLFICVQ